MPSFTPTFKVASCYRQKLEFKCRLYTVSSGLLRKRDLLVYNNYRLCHFFLKLMVLKMRLPENLQRVAQ